MVNAGIRSMNYQHPINATHKVNIYMVTKLLLIRHGLTNIPELEQQDTDALSEIGTGQIKKLSERLQGIMPISHIYCSNYKRAVQSAELIAKGTKSAITIDKRFHEIGIWLSPTQLHNPNSSPMHYDQAIKFLTRARETAMIYLREISKRHLGETIVLVSHGNIIRAITAAAIAAGVETTVRLKVDNASLTILEYDANGIKPFFTLTLFNDISHLG